MLHLRDKYCQFMELKSIIISLIFCLLTACNSDIPQIRVGCENETKGVYTVKWELFPMKQGTVRIFESRSPDIFDRAILVDEKPISDGFSIIRRENNQRHFFRLVFDKKYSSIVGERHILTDKVDNLRDLGGYYQGKTKQIKWGKIYRSGNLSNLSSKDRIILDSLYVKTVIDFRDEKKAKYYPSKYKAPVMKDIYLHSISVDSIGEKVIGGVMKKGDVLVSLQDMYAQILDKDTASLSRLFEILLDQKNYPLLYYCGLGKDKAGLVSILILEALGVDQEEIFYDYMLSNRYINFNRAVETARQLPVETQEALTTLLSVNEQLFNFIYEKIKMDYGSMNNYLEKKLNLTPQKKIQLREILLY